MGLWGGPWQTQYPENGSRIGNQSEARNSSLWVRTILENKGIIATRGGMQDKVPSANAY